MTKLRPISIALMVLGFAVLQGRALAQSPGDLKLPPNWADGNPITVEIGLHVMNVTSIDEVRGTFRLISYLFAQWRDKRLAFTPRYPGEKVRVLTPGSVWQPRFEFVNAVAPHQIYDSVLQVTPAGLVTYIERDSAALSTEFRLRRFPFDQQTLSLFVHPFIDQAGLIVFHDDDPFTSITTEQNLYSALPEWDIESINAHTKLVTTQGARISEARFDITVARRYGFYIWKVFLPLLLMVLLSWTVLWVDHRDLAVQVQISVTTILTVIAFAFAITLSLPKVPYLTVIDGFFLTCYVFVFLTAIELTCVHVANRYRQDASGLRIRRVSRMVLPLGYLACNGFIFWWFLR